MVIMLKTKTWGTSMIGKSQGKTEISLGVAEEDLPASSGIE